MAARAAIKMNHLILLAVQLAEEIRKCTEPALMPGEPEQRIEAELWSVVFTIFFSTPNLICILFCRQHAMQSPTWEGQRASLHSAERPPLLPAE